MPDKARQSTPVPIDGKDPIALEIKKAREEQGLSISELGRVTGISRTVLFGYEAGRTRPGAREIRLICSALRVSPNKLIFGTEQPFEERKGLASLIPLASSNPMAGAAMMMMIVPAIAALMGEEEKVALLTLVSGLIEARNKDAATGLRAMVEVISEEARAPEDMDKFAGMANDPEKVAAFQEKVKQRIDKIRMGK